MSAVLADLHWLRPGWLLLLPVLPLLLWLGRDTAGGDAWRAHCDPLLLGYLAESSPYRTRRWPIVLLLLGWLLGVLALGGPSWERAELPVYRSDVSRVVVLDLSRSMDATDVVPSRLARARFKVADLLARVAGGRVGLVVFAGDAFALAPLTDDVNTLLNLVPTLATELMPVQGSRADLGIERAVELLRHGGARRGDVLLVTDGAPAEAERSARLAREAGYRVAVLGVGTAAGAPIPDADGGFVKDTLGRIVVPGVDTARLLAIATAGGGRFATLSIDDGDIDRLLDDMLDTGLREPQGAERRHAGQRWRDRGPWLLLALLPLAALAFRRGWLLSAVVAGVLLPPAPASALQWAELWQRPEQRVHSALRAGDTEQAVQSADAASPAWRGSARYRAQDYAGAAEAFAADDTPLAHYNRGNALAHAGRLAEALDAYDRALAGRPGFEDAAFNRALIEQMLRNEQARPQQGDGQPGEEPESAAQDREQTPGGGPSEDPGEPGDPARADTGRDSGARQGDPAGGQAGSDEGSRAQPRSAASEAGDPGADGGGDTDATSDAGALQDGRPGEGRATTLAGTRPVDDATAARIEQMLRRVPDDPGGLLRRKFALEHARRARARLVVEQPW